MASASLDHPHEGRGRGSGRGRHRGGVRGGRGGGSGRGRGGRGRGAGGGNGERRGNNAIDNAASKPQDIAAATVQLKKTLGIGNADSPGSTNAVVTETPATTASPAAESTKQHQQRQSEHRSPSRRKQRQKQKRRSKKNSGKQGKENVCHQDLVGTTSGSTSPSKNDELDTTNGAVKPKQKRAAKNSTRQKNTQKGDSHDKLQQTNTGTASNRNETGKRVQNKPTDPVASPPNQNVFTESVVEVQKDKTSTEVQKDKTSTEANNSSKQDMVTDVAAEAGITNDSKPLQPESEKERMSRLLREARQKSSAAKEKKKNKKSKKHEKWLKEQEVEKSKRAKSWHDKIAQEKENIDLISKLIVAEFLRQNKGKEITKDQVLEHDSLAQESKNVHNAIFGGLQCRVTVIGCERQDLNERVGMLRYWDDDKEKFCVGLDTKRNLNSDVHFFMPGNLEPMPPARSTKIDKKLAAQSYDVELEFNLPNQVGDGIGCRFTLDKSAIVALHSAESIDAGLKSFCYERDEAERLLHLVLEKERKQEEEYRKQEEIDRKRRAARRAKDRADREAAREKMRREHEAARAVFALERRKEAIEKLNQMMIREMLEGMLESGLFESREELTEFLEQNDGGKFDGVDDFMEKLQDFLYSRREKEDAEEQEEKNRQAAEILGVEPDAAERQVKTAYRKLALKYHPDKWRTDSEHGMTKEEAEEHFKKIQGANDQLMSKFEDDSFEDEVNSYA